MQISFIGAGRVGASLGKYLTEKGQKVGGYYSRSPKSAAWAAEFTDTRHYHNLEEAISGSDMIFFTVPDDKIQEVWEEAKPFARGKIIAHCSGIHTSHIFSDIAQTGSTAYSIHPLCAVSSKEHSFRLLETALFTIEGDIRHISTIQKMFTQMGNRTTILRAEDKIRYHTAASLASNHMTAVFYMAEKLFRACGFEEETARQELYRLAKGNLDNILAQGCISSLTGPVERGDIGTVAKHIQALEGDMQAAYVENAQQLIEIGKQKNPDRDYTKFLEMDPFQRQSLKD